MDAEEKEMTRYQEWEHAKLDDIDCDTDKILDILEEKEMGEGFDSGLLAGLLGNRGDYGYGRGGMDGLAAMLGACMGNMNRGIDPAALLAMCDRNRDNGDWGDGGMLIVLFLILILGFGGNGGFFGRNGANDGLGVQGIDRTVVNEANYTRLMDVLQSQGTRHEMAIGQLAQALNCDHNQLQSALCGLDKEVALAQGDLKSAIQSCCCSMRTELLQSQNALQAQIAKCCCDTNLNIERQGCQTRQDIAGLGFAMQNQFCQTNQNFTQQINDLRVEMTDQFCQIKMREDQREIQSLRDEVANLRSDAQTAVILNQVRAMNNIGFTGTVAGTTVTGTGTIS